MNYFKLVITTYFLLFSFSVCHSQSIKKQTLFELAKNYCLKKFHKEYKDSSINFEDSTCLIERDGFITKQSICINIGCNYLVGDVNNDGSNDIVINCVIYTSGINSERGYYSFYEILLFSSSKIIGTTTLDAYTNYSDKKIILDKIFNGILYGTETGNEYLSNNVRNKKSKSILFKYVNGKIKRQ